MAVINRFTVSLGLFNERSELYSLGKLEEKSLLKVPKYRTCKALKTLFKSRIFRSNPPIFDDVLKLLYVHNVCYHKRTAIF